MTVSTKTIEYHFETDTTTLLATGTSLATSTRFDFSAITVYIPETTSRSFRSVYLEFGLNDAFTLASTQFYGFTFGIKLGAAAFDDVSRKQPTSFYPIAATSDPSQYRFQRDVTSYFNSNFGSGTSQTAQASIIVATSTAANVNNLTCKLIITYDYDVSEVTQIKTVRIPIQGHTTTLTTAALEIGTTGTSAIPTGNIPALDTFLKESSVVIRNSFIEIFSNHAGAATTNFNMFVQIDSSTESTRATIEQTNNGGSGYYDIFTYDTSTFLTSTTHQLKLRSSLTTRFAIPSAVLVITYEYNESTSTQITNSIMLPLCRENFSFTLKGSSVYRNIVYKTVDIQESNPNLLQSGIHVFFRAGSGGTAYVKSGLQSYRDFTLPTLAAEANGFYLMHNIDYGSGITLAAGSNNISVDMYAALENRIGVTGGYIFLNYYSDKDAAGSYVHNKTVLFDIFDLESAYNGSGIRTITTVNCDSKPADTYYYLNDLAYIYSVAYSAATYICNFSFYAIAGEYIGEGIYTKTGVATPCDAERSQSIFTFNVLDIYDLTPTSTTGKLKLSNNVSRVYSLNSTTSFWTQSVLCVTYNGLSVEGTTSGPTGYVESFF